MKAKNSISNLSLKRKIWVAVSLISLIPLIILLHYFSGYYITSLAIIILGLLVFLGWWVIFEVFSSISRVYVHSRAALKDIGEEAPPISDEVQSLDTIINLLSDKVKGGFEQLKDFTQKTEELNQEVTKKVLILSTILQANDLFSKDTPAEEVIKFLSHHLKQLLEADKCFCVLRENSLGHLKTVVSLGIDPLEVKSFIDKVKEDLSGMEKILILDNREKHKRYSSWAKDLGMNNIIISPIISKGEIIGVVGIGNNKDRFFFREDDVNVVNLFSQNVALIWEHEQLSSKIEELEIIDYLTGLYNEKTIIRRLDEEIKRASIYQRPCGFITVTIINYENYQKEFGLIEAEKIIKKVAKIFKKEIRPIDIPGRIGPYTLGAILIESNKRKSQEIADRLSKSLAQACSDKIKLSFSVAESPINGTSAQELMEFVQTQKNNEIS